MPPQGWRALTNVGHQMHPPLYKYASSTTGGGWWWLAPCVWAVCLLVVVGGCWHPAFGCVSAGGGWWWLAPCVWAACRLVVVVGTQHLGCVSTGGASWWLPPTLPLDRTHMWHPTKNSTLRSTPAVSGKAAAGGNGHSFMCSTHAHAQAVVVVHLGECFYTPGSVSTPRGVFYNKQ